MSLSILKKQDVYEIDEYELNLRENVENNNNNLFLKGSFDTENKNNYSSNSLPSKFCNSTCCKTSYKKWC